MILKNIEDKDENIKRLEGLLGLNLDNQQKFRIQNEIQNIKKGIAGEKESAFHINDVFKDSYIAHDIRLESEEEVVQIDHLVINKFGVVFLFESKNYSNDVMISKDGVFSYYDKKAKEFKPFPSPIEQSMRHERILRRSFFSKINFIPTEVIHMVLFNHKAKIFTKESQPFNNVCYPEALGTNLKKIVYKKGSLLILSAFKNKFVSAIKNSISPKEAIELLIKDYHKPFITNYHKKFGIKKDDDNKALTMAKAATFLKAKKTDLENLLVEKEFLIRHEKGYLKITESGKKEGITLQKGKFGFYILIPKTFLEKLEKGESK